MWWPIPAARGEKIVMLVPRSCCFLSWLPSIVSRISSSVTLNCDHDGSGFLSFTAATCCSR
jgi:hypothetical protein